ncbi:UDP-2,3-diacylglucosamine hydrolase [Candidatus Tenderia electrophaga]|uniref:UDP-2,3-diacylglucosamine hydrolase n=1 Tax=Candidatus Tenderia electrophaga TaxID=1748243 RepID=A0A0S2TAQ4_9GAMM|nr:UDP-2,3-diacylglucosamine hydrolase [Candidatus Tenderia electrophaga]
MSPIHVIRPLKYRAIWISDVHLGSKYSRAEFLLDFLKSTECEYLYLVGDIVDLWAMRKAVYWPQSRNNVIRSILGKAKRGTKIIYIPGNHDAMVRDFAGARFGEVEIRDHAIHTTVDGKKLLVLHGDEFDSVIRCNGLMSLVGCWGYDVLMWFNRAHNGLRRLLNLPYWSLASYLKQRVKNARDYIERFETIVAREAKRRGVDGLVCGHLHRPELTYIDEVLYCNDGDWVETCTALVERHDGSLQLLHWADEKHTLKDVQAEGRLSCAS